MSVRLGDNQNAHVLQEQTNSETLEYCVAVSKEVVFLHIHCRHMYSPRWTVTSTATLFQIPKKGKLIQMIIIDNYKKIQTREYYRDMSLNVIMCPLEDSHQQIVERSKY